MAARRRRGQPQRSDLDDPADDEQERVSCSCGRGDYWAPKYRSCYDCYLDRRAEYRECIFCGRWHSAAFDTCYVCRAERDDAGLALRQLIIWRDSQHCQNCGSGEGDERIDPISPPIIGPDGELEPKRVYVTLQIDHIVPCRARGTADEWNLQLLCSVCNRAKSDSWFPGCRYEQIKTELCRRYWLTGTTYFPEADLATFRNDVYRWRITKTWDPQTWLDADLIGSDELLYRRGGNVAATIPEPIAKTPHKIIEVSQADGLFTP